MAATDRVEFSDVIAPYVFVCLQNTGWSKKADTRETVWCPLFGPPRSSEEFRSYASK